jgi:translation initiation factor IF-2
MNLSELARKLHVPVEQLRHKLPLMGFDIGKKATKVDKLVAHRILRDWKKLNYELEEKIKRQAKIDTDVKQEKTVKRKVSIPSIVTVREFGEYIDKPVNVVIKELIKNGIFASLNERIDFDTACIIADDLGVELSEIKEDDVETINKQGQLKAILKDEKPEELQPRPPVVVIMGHVDHGKTRLLDTIRKSNVIAGERGGITQHIGAYQITKNGKKITFIDTPGHEAFTAMRARGAKVADIAILLVAADDSVKPQTIEALRIIEQSGLPMIVDINKVDKPASDVVRVKQDLSKYNIVPEDWGGKHVFVETSAMTGKGLDELLDMILLVSEMEQKNIMANPNKPAVGTVIESHIDKREGSVATLIIQNGSLKKGDSLCINNTLYGKVRLMKDWDGKEIKEALPSMPVKILGFKVSPKVGDVVKAADKEKFVKKKIARRDLVRDETITLVMPEEDEDTSAGKEKLKVILKADVLGSLEAIVESLEKINQEEIEIKIIVKGLGSITENDILRADAENAEIYGFNVTANLAVQNLARDKSIDINYFSVIYDLIDDVKQKMENLLSPVEEVVELGSLEVKAVFKTTKDVKIVGGLVSEGKIEKDSFFNIIRDKEQVGKGRLINLQTHKQVVSSVKEGQECGVEIKCKENILEGDRLDFYKIETKRRKLEF